MCGRYAAFLPAEAVARLFHTVNPLPNVPPSWNVAPSQDAMVVRRHPETGDRHLDLLKWGLVPRWTKDAAHAQRPINARSETVATSGMFRSAFAQRRCIVPADAFYEWQVQPAGKQPYAIARRDEQPLAFAGLWEGYRAPDGAVLRTFTIVTTQASVEMTPLHSRMPVILETVDWPAWLGETDRNPVDLLHPSPEGTLRYWPVSRSVNTPRNNTADLLGPVADALPMPDSH
jgi:putative SOS response-associated peptidase YedK